MEISKEKVYYAQLRKDQDSNGFINFLEVRKYQDRVVSVRIDGVNYDENPYGTYKSLSEKYNNAMHDASGTYYRDAKRMYEESILKGGDLVRVKGAGGLYGDLMLLIDKIKAQTDLDIQYDVNLK